MVKNEVDPNFTFYKPFMAKQSIDSQDLYEMNAEVKPKPHRRKKMLHSSRNSNVAADARTERASAQGDGRSDILFPHSYQNLMSNRRSPAVK